MHPKAYCAVPLPVFFCMCAGHRQGCSQRLSSMMPLLVYVRIEYIVANFSGPQAQNQREKIYTYVFLGCTMVVLVRKLSSLRSKKLEACLTCKAALARTRRYRGIAVEVQRKRESGSFSLVKTGSSRPLEETPSTPPSTATAFVGDSPQKNFTLKWHTAAYLVTAKRQGRSSSSRTRPPVSSNTSTQFQLHACRGTNTKH